MKRQIKNLTYTFLAAALFTGCSSESDPVTTVPDTNPDAISFTSYVGDMTRRTTETDEVPAALHALQQNGFKVFANRTATDWTTNGASSKSDFMYDQTVVFNPDPQIKAWSYSPPKVWPKSDKVSFFAYSPYNSQASTFTASPYNVSGATKLEYTHNNRIGSQDDLLAAASLDYTKATHSGSVGFNFYHTLSKLRFAYSREAIAQTTTVEVSKLELQYVDGTIQNKRVLNLAGVGASMTADIWSDPATETNYTGDACQAGSVLNGESVLLIPQTYEDGQLELVVSYKLTTNDPALPAPVVDEVVDRVIALPAIQGGLQPNKQYLYTLEIKPNAIQISSDITVGAWGEASSHEVKEESASIYYEDGVYHITDAEGLKIFADIVNYTNTEEVPGIAGVQNNTSVDGQLDSDIDLSEVCGPEKGNWTPIGNKGISGSAYVGHFDGQNHYVDNVYIHNESTQYQGLFGYVDGDSISNVKVRGVQIRARQYAGALCGYCKQGLITNCHVEANATYPMDIYTVRDCAAMVVGRVYNSTIKNCSAVVNGTTLNIRADDDAAAGFVGDCIGGKVENCSLLLDHQAQLQVSSNDYTAGGFVGRVYKSTMSKCKVYVAEGKLDITSNGYAVGGFCGYIGSIDNPSYLLNCSVETADVTNCPINVQAKYLRAGGLVGHVPVTSYLAGCSSAVTSVVCPSNAQSAGYCLGLSGGLTIQFYGTWAVCATAPASNKFVGGGEFTSNGTAYGTSQISFSENNYALNRAIKAYNNSAPADKQADYYNAQGTYGPIYDATQPAYQFPQ